MLLSKMNLCENKSMNYISRYLSPLGNILLSSDSIGLTGLWFEYQKYYAEGLSSIQEEVETDLLKDAKRWLDIYFSGKEPDFNIPLHFCGTDFQNDVWQVLCSIPYGHTITYKDIGKEIAIKRNLPHMSSQAIGGAVGHNRISIIVPCHRVVGSNGSLTGYAGGMERKLALLSLENVDMAHLFVPKNNS